MKRVDLIQHFEAHGCRLLRDGPDRSIQGSRTLYPQLLETGLMDQLTFMNFPVILGRGKRLFGDGTPSRSIHIVEHEVTPGGNIIATYEPNGEVQIGSFAMPEPSAAELVRRNKIEAGT